MGGEQSVHLISCAVALSAALIDRLDEQPQTVCADQAAWSAHLDRMGLSGLTAGKRLRMTFPRLSWKA
jgi:hypothetical protein